MKTKHTPGPWMVIQANHRMRVARRIGNPGEPGWDYRPVTYDWPEKKSSAKKGTSPSYYGWNEADIANARLIAAAPDLLEAVSFAADDLEAIRDDDKTPKAVRMLAELSAAKLRKAIALATGQNEH